MKIREQAHREAVRLSTDAIAAKLEHALGQQLTAYAVGIRDPRAIGKYARGQRPRRETEARLRDLYVVIQILLTRETAETVRAWMMGAHPLLEDQAPVQLLHVESTEESQTGWSYGPGTRSRYQAVLDAATAFVGASAEADTPLASTGR